ncbi:sigma factor-like helix-turn-helix DNA-binding protein [Novosphingobium resinovorum]
MAMQSRNHNQAQIAAGSERRDRISRLRSEGWTFKRIAAELHISQSRAAQIHKRAVELDEQASRTIPAHRITRQTPIEILPLSIRTSSALLNGAIGFSAISCRSTAPGSARCWGFSISAAHASTSLRTS